MQLSLGKSFGIPLAIAILAASSAPWWWPWKTGSDTPEIQATTSNVAIGNSGPVNQNLIVNPQPEPLLQVVIDEPSKKEADGLFHTKLIIGIGVVTGAKEPELSNFSPPPEISCSPYTRGGNGFTAFGPLAGRMQYTWKTECVSNGPLTEGDSVRFSIKYN